MVLQDLADLTQGDELAGDRDHTVGAAQEGDVTILVPQRKIPGRIAPRVPRPVGLRDSRLITLDIDERPGPRKPEHGLPRQPRTRGDTRRIDDVQSTVREGGAVRGAAGVRPGVRRVHHAHDPTELELAPGVEHLEVLGPEGLCQPLGEVILHRLTGRGHPQEGGDP